MIRRFPSPLLLVSVLPILALVPLFASASQFSSQYPGQYTGQYTGQYARQYAGQYRAKTPAQYPGYSRINRPRQMLAQLPGQAAGTFWHPQGRYMARPLYHAGNAGEVSRLVSFFDDVVFGEEFSSISTRGDVISKWSGRVGVSMQGRVSDELAAMARRHLKTLGKLTNLEFHEVEPNYEGQAINIVFLKRSEMSKLTGPGIDAGAVRTLAASGGCYFMAFHRPEEQIVKSIIVVNIEREAHITDSCLLEEITQSLGMPNDSDQFRPSIFSDLDRENSLSRHDEIIIRTLYDSRMRPGSPRSEAIATARIIIGEMTGDWR